ncbi:hypothetical protein LZ31DRAFT_560379 [Colletotrichum somersetense]|nr:hypothetical protein LZ31DRAFT_560379 [Colletotrichum somersetense]
MLTGKTCLRLLPTYLPFLHFPASSSASLSSCSTPTTPVPLSNLDRPFPRWNISIQIHDPLPPPPSVPHLLRRKT